jgi:hypothetical protein
MTTTTVLDPLPRMDVAARADRLRARFDEAAVDALLVTHLPNIRYLTGFTGSAALLLVTADAARSLGQACPACGGDGLGLGVGRHFDPLQAGKVVAGEGNTGGQGVTARLAFRLTRLGGGLLWPAPGQFAGRPGDERVVRLDQAGVAQCPERFGRVVAAHCQPQPGVHIAVGPLDQLVKNGTGVDAVPALQCRNAFA